MSGWLVNEANPTSAICAARNDYRELSFDFPNFIGDEGGGILRVKMGRELLDSTNSSKN